MRWRPFSSSLPSFAALKLGAVGSYGNEMDGAVVVVEIGITIVVAAITLIVALVANRGSG